jgi:carboxylesterase
MRSRLYVAAALLLAGCQGLPAPTPGELDDGMRPHKARLMSQELASPTKEQLAAPIVIAVHGFGATEFETQLAADALRAAGTPCSQVLLGGHGTSLADFAGTTWLDWQQPVIAEHRALVAKGFTDIRYLAASTGVTLVLDGIARGEIAPVPQRMGFVAPLVDVHPEGRLVGYAPLLQLFGSNGRFTAQTGTAKGNWYAYKPAKQYEQLVDVTEVVKARLRAGMAMPATVRIGVFQSQGDKTVDPKGAEALRRGLRGPDVRVEYLDSAIHVPIWPDGVTETFTERDRATRSWLLGALVSLLGPSR